MNRTLLGMLRSLPEQHKSNWKDHVAKLVHAYNCTRHETTGYSPFFLLFGRSPRLPIDLAFRITKPNDPTGYPQYVAKWKTAMQEAYAKASTSANKTAKRGKKNYDKKVRSTILHEGDRVLVRNLSPRGGPGKLRSFWEEEVHVVVSRKGPDSPVYEVRSESKKKKPRTLHRNMLLPCDYLSSESVKPKPRERKTPVQDPSVDENVDSSDEEFPFVRPGLRVEVPDNSCRSQGNLSDAKRPTEKEPEILQDQPREDEDNAVEEEIVDGENQLNTVEDNAGEEQLVNDEDQPDETEPDTVPGNDPVAGAEETVGANAANRPRRNRQAPQRLAYYAPGHAACYHCGAMITQLQQPIPQPFQFQQPIPPYQFQQPIPQPFQFQQPIPPYQFQQPALQPFHFQQPVPQACQVPMPTQQPWYFDYPMFPMQWQ